jgi:hypothetical protein
MSKHWTPQRKAALVEQARHETDRAVFAQSHGVSIEELNEWTERFNAHGLAGLSARKVQAVMKRARRTSGVYQPTDADRDYCTRKAARIADDRRRGR